MNKISTNPGMFRLIVTLTFITLLSGAILGFLYQMTAPVIQANEEERLKSNLTHLLDSFDNNPLGDAFTLEEFPGLRFLPAMREGRLSALAVESTSTRGYAGAVTLLVGFRDTGEVLKVAVLRQKETPGLGTRMTEESFLRQFVNLLPDSFPLKVKKDGGSIDALTAATISSRAFLDAMNIAQAGASKALAGLKERLP